MKKTIKILIIIIFLHKCTFSPYILTFFHFGLYILILPLYLSLLSRCPKVLSLLSRCPKIYGAQYLSLLSHCPKILLKY